MEDNLPVMDVAGGAQTVRLVDLRGLRRGDSLVADLDVLTITKKKERGDRL
jgi:hypothetical protein